MAEQRYEREIDELLQRLAREDREPLPFRRRRTPPWTAAWQRLSGTHGVHSLIERLMALAVVLLVATLFLGLSIPALARLSGLLAVISFVAALAVSVGAGAQGRDPRRYQAERLYNGARGGAVDWDALVRRFRTWLRRFQR
jgi:hypothetical protein